MAYVGIAGMQTFPVIFSKVSDSTRKFPRGVLESKLEMTFKVLSTEDLVNEIQNSKKDNKTISSEIFGNLLQAAKKVLVNRTEDGNDTISATIRLRLCDSLGADKNHMSAEIILQGDFLRCIFSEYKGPGSLNANLDVDIVVDGRSIWSEDLDAFPSISKQEVFSLKFASSTKATLNSLKEGTEYEANLRIFLQVIAPITSSFTGEVQLTSVKTMCARMLTNQIECDFELVAENGKRFPCNKAFLAVYSPVLAQMLKTECKEVEEKAYPIILSEIGLQAFLNFIYKAEVSEAIESSTLAFELLEAAHKYDVATLEKAMETLFLIHSITWINIDVAVMLYLHTLKVDGNEQLTWKVIQVMKSKPDELVECDSFDKLLKEDPETAKGIIRLLPAKTACHSPARKKFKQSN